MRLRADGINYKRAHNQNVVCMPARATIITGQYVATHGVWMNGVALPEETPTIAHWLSQHGYRTGLFGKAHFEPWLGAPETFYENRMARLGETGPHRGFDRMELANHFYMRHSHYDVWLEQQPPRSHRRLLSDGHAARDAEHAGGGATGAIQVWDNPVPREVYHTDWVAQRTIAWLDSLPADADWFVWLSFPDPHHPWDPPASERSRVDWRDVPLPDLYPGDAETAAQWLATSRAIGRATSTVRCGRTSNRRAVSVPCDLTADQVREINAMNHIENELIDDACGRVLACIERRGWSTDTDVLFTTDHGEFQGDYGLLFKGPYHCDALMRLPLIWRPAPSADVTPATRERAGGHVDLAQTFCRIAGIAEPDWVEGQAAADHLTTKLGRSAANAC